MTHLSLITSEAVAIGHPDKVADQISDAILDACLAQDQESRVACESLVSRGLIVLAGEINCCGTIDYDQIVRNTLKAIGYVDPTLGLDYRSCGIVSCIKKQSPDIAQGVDGTGLFKEQGAGDQGIIVGYATDETPQFMPLSFVLAHQLLDKLLLYRIKKRFPFLGPDGKSQVTLAYDSQGNIQHIDTIIVSTQHSQDTSYEIVKEAVMEAIKECCPKHLLKDSTHILINPTGRFVIGGPAADTGLTGRKLMVDTYGSVARHGGGAFSGKDPTKVDRSAAYAARYIAKHIVAAKLAKQCEVHIAYAIGVSSPIALHINLFDTGSIDETSLKKAIIQIFDLTPLGIISMLNLRRPIYYKTAYGGHFGRNDPDFTWEKLDRIEPLLRALRNY